jgi:glycosyltransferase involved in cell wall biosynthesis
MYFSAISNSAEFRSKLRSRYVLVTPARNEAKFIEATIRSVVAQSVRPERWLIVSDGSTDGTDQIVSQFTSQYEWIKLFRMPEHRDRQFAAKANAFNAGYILLADVEYEIVGNLDADITFESDYFEFLISKFEDCPILGVTGTPFIEENSTLDKHSYSHNYANLDHVSGACQLFRRECFNEVGKYVAVRGGAVDWIAVTTARMMGWKTRTFTEKICFHHRNIGTGNNSPLLVFYHYGKKAYYVGGHPLWAIIRGIFQMRGQPFVIGGFLFQLGFLWGFVSRTVRPVSKTLMAFHRYEQMTRLLLLLHRYCAFFR